MQQHASVPEKTDLGKSLREAGLSGDNISRWLSAPRVEGYFGRDREIFSRFWKIGSDLLGALPEKPARRPKEKRAAEAIMQISRETRDHFLAHHAEALYRA